ncbi:Alcohol dehydrogenase GroES domain protein [Haloterrigena turkmenica DSM 5511]|uniref:Alcohol dehydrogenase GroES domain protein n=1 Tax=Haloterrigena turkmenica (strain ATCC 51198 / DSM 5511 / JCM 9101 / NCIMB 13204 / VKM B-1734 / 4k) TaxID=543526 RepID=D2RSY4_HALTV|nr:NADPH:quinone reductase [Haloterrigena turkmenica]ADB60864.1 Alcohol dehydrogenase GroES domain protein [Haloterrigena turkmenica DSM 5511]
MRAVRLHEHGDADVLQVDDVDRPEPGADELLLEVAAAGVNPVDTYFRDGSYEPVDVPFTPGVDFAGVVAETGAGVDEFSEGDRVFGTGIGNGGFQGAYAEYATVPTDRVVQLPDGADLAEAGAAGVAAVTAWRALVDHAALDPAEYCLVHGGSGGVGHAAVQIADAVSARVITTASDEYHETLEDLGAETVLDYARDDLADAVLEASDGGVDAVLDHRLDDYLQFDADVAATGCRVVGIGENSPDPGFSNDGAARSKDVSYQFMSMFNTPDLRVPLRGVAHLMATDGLSIELAQTYDLAEAAQAQRDVMSDSFLGKLVLEP